MAKTTYISVDAIDFAISAINEELPTAKKHKDTFLANGEISEYLEASAYVSGLYAQLIELHEEIANFKK